MARENEKRHKLEEYDSAMAKIREERMNMQRKYERDLEEREREYH